MKKVIKYPKISEGVRAYRMSLDPVKRVEMARWSGKLRWGWYTMSERRRHMRMMVQTRWNKERIARGEEPVDYEDDYKTPPKRIDPLKAIFKKYGKFIR